MSTTNKELPIEISVVGLGQVGLITAVCFAKKGCHVIGVETDNHRIERLRNAEAPFFEPHLDEYLKEVIGSAAFSVTNDPTKIASSELIFIAVGTPSRADGSIDLTQVAEASRTIGSCLRSNDRYCLVVIKSTVSPGTARSLAGPIIERESRKSIGIGFGMCSNPEFLREGTAIHDAEFPDRIVIGSDDPTAISKLENFYKNFYNAPAPPIVRTTHESAELIKYANNAFLATKVSFINCIANIAERIPNADIASVATSLGLDPRIGSQFLNAGLGWGGSCFPKDLEELVAFSKTLGYNPELIESAIATNRKQREKAVQFAKETLKYLKGKRIAILGLSFKPDTDDIRDAVSVPVIKSLLAEGATVVAYDPVAIGNARMIFHDAIEYARNPIECILQADCCIIATEWDQFRKIPPKTFLEKMRTPFVVDGRRIYDPREFARAGVQLSAVGLGPMSV